MQRRLQTGDTLIPRGLHVIMMCMKRSSVRQRRRRAALCAFRAADEPGTPTTDLADRVQSEAERRAKLQQHLSAALSTAIVPCQPMVVRSADMLAGETTAEPGEDAPEDAAYWDLVSSREADVNMAVPLKPITGSDACAVCRFIFCTLRL